MRLPRLLAVLSLLVATCAQAQVGSRDFEGTPDVAETDTAATTTGPVTLFAWVNTDSVDGVNTGLVGLADKDTETDHFRLARDLDDLRCETASAAGGGDVAGVANSLTIGTWSAAGCVCAATNSRVAWVDGVTDTDSTNRAWSATLDRTSIGRYGDSSPDGYYNGQLAHAAIWSSGLSDSHMRALTVGYSPQFIDVNNLEGWWPSMTSHATTLLDRSGNGLDLTMTGSPPTSTSGPRVFVPVGGQ